MTEADDIDVRRETFDAGVILTPIGDVDLSRAPALRLHLLDTLRTAPRRLIVDLREVPYMDSSGVATFIEAMQIARKHDCRLLLCGLQERVRSIFEIARLDTVFTILDDAEAARSA